MKPTHRIKETGIELQESETNKDVFVEVEKNHYCWHRRDIETLGFTIEPIVREKRLYAYKDSHGWIAHRVDLNNKALDIYTRCEEYDILYPEE